MDHQRAGDAHDGRTRRVDVSRAPDDGASGQSMLYTKAVYDGRGYRVRACGNNANGSHRTCTGWH